VEDGRVAGQVAEWNSTGDKDGRRISQHIERRDLGPRSKVESSRIENVSRALEGKICLLHEEIYVFTQKNSFNNNNNNNNNNSKRVNTSTAANRI
jgi:hypothetical protein